MINNKKKNKKERIIYRVINSSKNNNYYHSSSSSLRMRTDLTLSLPQSYLLRKKKKKKKEKKRKRKEKKKKKEEKLERSKGVQNERMAAHANILIALDPCEPCADDIRQRIRRSFSTERVSIDSCDWGGLSERAAMLASSCRVSIVIVVRDDGDVLPSLLSGDRRTGPGLDPVRGLIDSLGDRLGSIIFAVLDAIPDVEYLWGSDSDTRILEALDENVRRRVMAVPIRLRVPHLERKGWRRFAACVPGRGARIRIYPLIEALASGCEMLSSARLRRVIFFRRRSRQSRASS